MTEVEATLQHVSARLRASVDLAAHVSTRIYHATAPQPAPAMPFVIYKVITGVDRGYIGRSVSGPPRPQFMTVEFQVDVYNTGREYQPLFDAQEDINAAVTVMGTQGGYHLSPCVRTLTLPSTETLGGVTYNRVLVTYAVNVSKLS